jgi:hypothetical protein
LSKNAKTFVFWIKFFLKSFGVSENSRTFASAFASKIGVSAEEKSSLKDLHKTEEVVQEARDEESLG